MARYVRLLLGAQLRLLYNTFRRGRPMARVGWIVAGLFLLGAAAGSGFAGVGLQYFLSLLQRPDVVETALQSGLPITVLQADTLLQNLLALLVVAVWGIVLMGGLGTAVSNLYLSGDLDLLISAPIPMRAVFTAKLLSGLGTGYLLILLLGGPALVGMGRAGGYPWPYFLGVLLLLLFLPLAPEALGTLLVMALVRVIPPRRLREALHVLGGILGAGFYFFSQISQGQMDPETAGRLALWLHRLNLPLFPQRWAAHGLVSLSADRYLEGALGLGAFLLFSLGLFFLALVTAERLYYNGWATLRAEPAATRLRRTGRAISFRDLPLLPRPIQGIMFKDLRLLPRDPQAWTGNLMAVAVLAIFLWQVARQEEGGTVMSLVGAGMVFLLSISLVSRLALGGIGSERKQIWLLRCAPVSSRQILWAKFLSAYLLYLLLTGLMLGLWSVIAGAEGAILGGCWLLLALLGGGVLGISVGLGASFPRLDSTTQQVVSPGVGCLYFPISMTYAGLVAATLLLPPLVSAFAGPLSLLRRVLWIGGPLSGILLTFLAVWLPIRIGAARLSALDL